MVVCSLMACHDETEVQERPAYDPATPITLTSFFPDSGRIRDEVILEGGNFGTDISKIRVYFNKTKAPVIGTSGRRIFATVPRMPGDTCTVSIAAGDGQTLGFDSVVYEHLFRYRMTVSVSTVCGNGTYTNRPGSLDQALISPFQLDVDGNGNIFVGTEHGFEGGNTTDVGFVRINETENTMELIQNMGTISGDSYGPRFEGINADKFTGMLYTTVRQQVMSYVTIDPSENWIPRLKMFHWVNNPAYPEYDGDYPTTTGNYMGYNQFDGYMYTRFSNGHIVRIDPKTGEGMVIYKTSQTGTSIGIDFDPKHPEMLYIAGYNSTGMAHRIWRLNLTTNEWVQLNGASTAGHRDGHISQAMFNTPYGLRFDMNGIAYISDLQNHCIRKYDPETGMVSTVLGIPGTSGSQDGGQDDATFNQPSAVGVDMDGNVYVADRANRRVRKLAIE
ncbi:MAG: IPT/TIG domain-containing protein [Bacteroidales bacterium]|nr:IPT/TIG domain-containing protein [Bacteroidales bacterium]